MRRPASSAIETGDCHDLRTRRGNHLRGMIPWRLPPRGRPRRRGIATRFEVPFWMRVWDEAFACAALDCILAVLGEAVNCALAGGHAKHRVEDRS